MLPALVVPAFGGKGSSILHFGLHVRLWRQVAHLEPSWEDSALIPRMGGVARQACVSATSEHTLNNDGADRISTILHEHFAPDAVESVYPAVVRLLQFEGSGQTMDVFSSLTFRAAMQSRKCRRAAVSVDHSYLSSACKLRRCRSPISPWDWPAFRAIRIFLLRRNRLSGPCGGAARQDVLVE